MRTHLPRAAAALALVALPLAACSSDDDGGSNGSDTTDAPSDGALSVDALDALKFDPEELTAPAGEITIRLVDAGSLRHTLVIEDHEADLHLEVSGDGSDEGTLTLEAGEYTYYCDVAGHRAAGMEGTLTVG